MHCQYIVAPNKTCRSILFHKIRAQYELPSKAWAEKGKSCTTLKKILHFRFTVYCFDFHCWVIISFSYAIWKNVCVRNLIIDLIHLLVYKSIVFSFASISVFNNTSLLIHSFIPNVLLFSPCMQFGKITYLVNALMTFPFSISIVLQ